jgi:segregation and condensation protein B
MSHDGALYQRIVEGALFAAGEPLTLERLMELFDEKDAPTRIELQGILDQLIRDYADRSIELITVAGGYQFRVKQELSAWIQRLWPKGSTRYSKALLEILVIIAYRQPMTRGEIEEIRGIQTNSTIIHTLLDHGWIKISGYRPIPGKPALYVTTEQFLNHFGLHHLQELPALNINPSPVLGESSCVLPLSEPATSDL